MKDESHAAEREAVRVRLNALVKAFGAIVYDHDLVTDGIDWDGDAERALGLSVGELGDTAGEFLARVHPDDLPGVAALIAAPDPMREVFEIEYRFRRGDGGYVWMCDRGVIHRASDGTALRYIGVMTDITTRKQAEQAIHERSVLAEFAAAVGAALTHGDDLRSVLQACCEATVRHLNAAFARIWTLNDATNVLELQASAGMYTHINGDHARVPVGKFKIGLIAEERKPHLTNSVVGDPRVGNQEWARKTGMASFAGYPLMIGERVVGVMAMFARHTLSDLVTDAMASVADTVALGIARQRGVAALRISERLANAANVAKSAFLANMSHEIRTPMTAIVGFADELAEAAQKQNAPPECLEAVEAIRRNGSHLLHVINDILDLSKIEAGRFVLDRTACALDSLIAEVHSTLLPRAAAKGLSLSLECLGAIPARIRTDPVRLRQILLNVLGNGIKFTGEGGVRLVMRLIDAQTQLPQMQFDFLDTGIGMTTEQAARVFEPFAQGDESTTRKFGGTGLGLAISKRLAEMLGGDLVIADTAPGVGTRFRLTIDPGPFDDGSMIESLPAAVAVRPAPAPVSTTGPNPPTLRARVLLVEDGLDNQRLISLILRRAGAEVDIVDNGREAVASALAARREGKPYAVVLMDMQMPEMDGYEATRRLRAEGYDLPIIALTAHAMVGDREKCLKAGCDDFATKPVDRAALLTAIRSFVMRRPDGSKESVRLANTGRRQGVS